MTIIARQEKSKKSQGLRSRWSGVPVHDVGVLVGGCCRGMAHLLLTYRQQ
jgi:hypothetical protein